MASGGGGICHRPFAIAIDSLHRAVRSVRIIERDDDKLRARIEPGDGHSFLHRNSPGRVDGKVAPNGGERNAAARFFRRDQDIGDRLAVRAALYNAQSQQLTICAGGREHHLGAVR